MLKPQDWRRARAARTPSEPQETTEIARELDRTAPVRADRRRWRDGLRPSPRPAEADSALAPRARRPDSGGMPPHSGEASQRAQSRTEARSIGPLEL